MCGGSASPECDATCCGWPVRVGLLTGWEELGGGCVCFEDFCCLLLPFFLFFCFGWDGAGAGACVVAFGGGRGTNASGCSSSRFLFAAAA